MKASSKRPEHLAWGCLFLSALFFVVTLLLGRWSEFFAVSAVSWLHLSAVLIWLVLAIQFHQRALAEQERLDAGRLAADRQSGTIFEGRGESGVLFEAASRRLEILEKWFIPIFAVAIAAYEVGVGLYLLRGVPGGSETGQSGPFLLCAVCMTAVAFVSFLMSRYATGMSAEPNWRPLRAGGSFLLGIAVVCFGLAVGLALANFQIRTVVRVIDYVVPVLLLVLGAETAMNVVLDIYRPRLKGQYSRAAFDSRLLGVINEPGGIFRSAAAAIDYQFGFKVSQTWFYKLLEKAIVPLLLFAGVILYLLSCIVVVAPNEEAIIEHLGDPLDKGGRVRLVGPGLALKWPWPIDRVRRFPTQRVWELHIGYVPKTDPETGRVIREKHLLWGAEHYKEEYDWLAASEYVGREPAAGAVPVSLIKANVPVQYRVKDLYSYIYNYDDPKSLLEDICYQELTKFIASAKVEVDEGPAGSGSLEESLFGAGKERAKRVLTERVQQAANRAGLGVEIVFLGLQGIHPPVEVAADYQAVVGAVQKRQTAILEAEAERNSQLSALAGSLEDTDELYWLAQRYRQAKTANDSELLERLGKELDEAFARAGGEIFTQLREAQTYAFERETLAKATGLRFGDQLKAYRAAKGIYKREQRLRVFEEVLGAIRKYVVVADPNDMLVFTVNFEEELMPNLYDITGFEESSEK